MTGAEIDTFAELRDAGRALIKADSDIAEGVAGADRAWDEAFNRFESAVSKAEGSPDGLGFDRVEAQRDSLAEAVKGLLRVVYLKLPEPDASEACERAVAALKSLDGD